MSLRAVPGSIRRARDEPGETLLKVREAAQPDKADLKRKLEQVDSAKNTTVDRPLPIRDTSEEELAIYPEDADEVFSVKSEDSEDEEEMLIRELARIKQERADEELKRQAREAAKQAAMQEAHAVSSNPLFQNSNSSLHRRWDDDTVFHGQASSSATASKTFVNDVVRSEFHKKFLDKYIQ